EGEIEAGERAEPSDGGDLRVVDRGKGELELKGIGRTILINVVLSLAAVLFILGAAEAWFRLTWKPPKVSTADRYAEDPQLNHVFTPNMKMRLSPHPEIPEYEFQTNALGLRYVTDYPIKKPAGVVRLVVCGDSFTEGYEYAKSIPARIDAALAPLVKEKGKELQVIHAGIGTYSPMLH